MQAILTGLISPPPSIPSACKLSSRPLSYHHCRAGRLRAAAGAGDGLTSTPFFWSASSAEALALPASASIEEAVKQTLSSPLQQEGKIGEFILFSAGLCFMFWLGNYVVPDLLVKRMQSADENVGKDGMEFKDKRRDPKKDRILDALVGSSDSKPSISIESSQKSPEEDLLYNDTSKGYKRSPRRLKKEKQKSQ